MFSEQLTLPVILLAALLDSVNPCVFGVLIFLLSFLMTVYKSPTRMLIAGLIYAAVVYVTYFVLGFGILLSVVGIGWTKALYWVAAFIAIGAGLLEIKDFFWYGKGVSLAIPKWAAKRITGYIEKIKGFSSRNIWLTYGMAAFLGFFVPLVELPCTGAPYFAILALIGEGDFALAVPYLLLYNFVFILPLLVVIGLAYFGKSSDAMEAWRKRHRRLMRLLTGLFLLALGAYMAYTVMQA